MPPINKVKKANVARFDAFEVNFELRELRRNGERVCLRYKPFRILEVLLKHPGSLVTRTELANDLWPHLPLSFEHNLNAAMNVLRQALGDSPRGRRFIETCSGLGYRFVAEVLNQDTGCAAAWAGLADAYSRLALSGTVAAADVCHKARESAREAVLADSNLAAAHVSQGCVRMVFDGNWKGAETDFLRALEIDEGLADAHCARAMLLNAVGEHERALGEGRRAQELEPLSMRIGAELVRILYLSRDYDAAIEECRDLLFLEPRFWPAHRILGLVCAHLGWWEEAITEVENACVYSDRHPAAVCALGCVSAALGRREQAEVALRELDPQTADNYMSWYWHAAIHAWHNEPVAAFESLGAACTQRDPLLLFLGVDPVFDSLRTHSGFAALLQRLGLDD
ncbi:MAG: winged helix-turn-helix domain-containing protein [Bryobacteraceae bacterium]